MVKLLLGTGFKTLSIDKKQQQTNLLKRYIKDNAANQCVRIYEAIKDQKITFREYLGKLLTHDKLPPTFKGEAVLENLTLNQTVEN